MAKRIAKMNRAELVLALAREYRWKEKGLSYSTRRIGEIRKRLAETNPPFIAELRALIAGQLGENLSRNLSSSATV